MGIPSDQAARMLSPRTSSAIAMRSNERLCAAALLSPFNSPSCMAVRTSYGIDASPTLAAIAGPMGITVVDILTPQRPWLMLNYASATHVSSVGLRDASHGGISTMAFQPGGRADECKSSILLASARGSGILIWDCSGRALNPMLGRLNASDAWGGGASNDRKSQVGADSGDAIQNQFIIRPSQPTSTDSTPVPTDRKSSAVSISSTSSQGTSNAAASGVASSTTAVIDSSNKIAPLNTNSVNISNLSSTPSACSAVTSLAWKGPSAPILLATVGSTACLFDLRTSLLSGVDDTSGGRPYARFTTPDSDSTMVHCSYSHDESLHIFSTLDSSGVVRLWDDRKCSSLSTSADCCLTSFLAHTRTGVGISAMPPSQSDDKSNATSRWMTWGLDLPVHGIEAVDELAVKVWDPLPKQTQQSRAATMSTVSADEDDLDKSEERRWLDSFHVTSHMSMQGAVAARVHPLAPDEVMLFRPQLNTLAEYNESESVEEDVMMDDTGVIGNSPFRAKRRLASSIASSPDTPLAPSIPPNLTVNNHRKDQENSKDDTKQGWETQLMRIKGGVVEKIADIRGGGRDEDVLCIAPGNNNAGDSSQIVAVELAHASNEMFMCSLTENVFRVYRLPELNIKANVSLAGSSAKKEATSTVKILNSVPSVYKKQESASWWNQSEEDVFGDLQSTQTLHRFEGESSLRASTGRNINRSPLPIVENITDLIAEKSSAAVEDEILLTTANEGPEANPVIDLNKARRCPCPPLCGVSFGRAGELVAFNNGPVKKMFRDFELMKRSSGNKPNQPYNEKPIVFNEITTSTVDLVENEKKSEEEMEFESGTPRSLFDLIEMQSAAKIAQWGVEVDNDSTNSNAQSSSNSSCADSSDHHSFGESSDDESNSDDSDGFCHVANKFDDYFANSRKSLTHVDMDTVAAEEQEERKQFSGIASLAPNVFVTHKYDGFLLNGQNPQIAQMLELGFAWWLLSDFSTPTSWEHSEKIPASWNEVPAPHTPDTEYARQPSQIESSRSASMVGNLKKTFTMQSPSASIPADQRLFRNKKRPILPTLDKQDCQPLSSGNNEKVPLGMYVTERFDETKTMYEQFTSTQKLCLRNAKLLRDAGDNKRSDTWTLLAQVVQSSQSFLSDGFDGWGSRNDAITTGLIEQLLQYYEKEGDFQMLASIVCVLTLGRDRRCTKKQQSQCFDKYMLLPQHSTKDQIRFDNYLYRYSDLLYSWGLLTKKNEITKRLSHSMPESRTELVSYSPIRVSAVQCSICCSAIKGASLFCPSCGHGGHLQHLIQWFETNQTCPTGCGCTCMDSRIEGYSSVQ